MAWDISVSQKKDLMQINLQCTWIAHNAHETGWNRSLSNNLEEFWMESCIRWESHAMHWKPRCSGGLVEHKDHCSPALVRSIARKLHSLLPICPFLPSYCLHLLAKLPCLGSSNVDHQTLDMATETERVPGSWWINIGISYAGYMTIRNASNEPCLDCGGKDFPYMFATTALIISFFLPHMWFSKLSAFKHTLRDTHVQQQ